MKRRAFLTGVGAAVLAPAVHAQFAVIDVASIAQQLRSFLQEVKAYGIQLEQLANELNMYKNMIQNTVALPFRIWSEVQSDIYAVQSIGNAASLLTGNSGSIISRLNQLQSAGYQIGTTTEMLARMPGRFDQWHNTIGNAAQSFGQALGLQQDQLRNQAALQEAIQGHADSADGQLRVMQAGVEMAGSNGKVLQEMQQTLIGIGQMQTNEIIVRADRQAQRDATISKFTAGDEIPTTGSQGW